MRIKLIIGLVLLLLVVIFSIQNAEMVSIKFLIWEISLSRALMIFLVFCFGGILGWIFSSLARSAGK